MMSENRLCELECRLGGSEVPDHAAAAWRDRPHDELDNLVPCNARDVLAPLVQSVCVYMDSAASSAHKGLGAGRQVVGRLVEIPDKDLRVAGVEIRKC